MFGFTYNGVHSSKFGLYYTQTAEEKWFKDAEFDVYDEDVNWRHGGYYYGSKAKIRTFTIECVFEEIDIYTREKIKQWLKRDTSGRLIFDDMPFVYWNVRPGKIPVGNWYLDSNDSHSGTVTITFNAYEPFGYLIRKSNTGYSPDDHASDYCNIINSNEMPAAPSTSSTTFYIYNPGTEQCGLSIEIAGSTSNPIRFINDRNSTVCEFGSLPSGGHHVRIDGDTGYVAEINNGSSANGFAYHNKGVVRLEPNEGFSNVDFVYLGVNGTTYTFGIEGANIDSNIVGASMRITGVSNTTFTVIGALVADNRIYCSRSGAGIPPSSGKCSIQTTNKVQIQEKVNNVWTVVSTLSLSYIDVDYNPRLL